MWLQACSSCSTNLLLKDGLRRQAVVEDAGEVAGMTGGIGARMTDMRRDT